VAPPPTQAALAWLEAQGVADAPAMLRAAGEPLLARDMATQGIQAAAWQRVPAAVRRGDGSVFAGWSLPAVVDALCKLCHDTMCVHGGGEARYFDTKAVPVGATWPELRAWSIDLARASAQADHPWHALLAVDALVFRARRVWA
jgi:DNA polymerase-3 subunit delta'